MSQPGFGVMIQALFGDRGNVDLKQYVGQVITDINRQRKEAHVPRRRTVLL